MGHAGRDDGIFATLALGLLGMILSDELSALSRERKLGWPAEALIRIVFAAAVVSVGWAMHVEYD